MAGAANSSQNGRPGRLRGGQIRQLPEETRRRILGRVKEDTGSGRRLKSARYRVTGYRDGDGRWIVRNPRSGHYGYRVGEGKKRKWRSVRPVEADVQRSRSLTVEVELDRGQGPRIYYTTVHGPFR